MSDGHDGGWRANELWIRWGGVVPGDHVLLGAPGAWVWWEVARWADDGFTVTLRGVSGREVSGVPPIGSMVRVRPASERGWASRWDLDAAMASAAALAGSVLGGRELRMNDG